MTPGTSARAVGTTVRLSLRTVTAFALALLAVCATATAGSAHARLTGTDPEDGARLKATPDTVTLTFSDPLDREFVRVRLSGPGDAVLPVAPRVKDGTVTFTVPSKLPGTYSVAFRVVSKDGHPVSGTLSFVVTGAPPVSPSLDATATPTDGGTATTTPTQTGTATTSPAPAPTPTVTTEPTGSTGDGAPTGLLAGIGAVVLALGAAAWFAVGRRRS